MDQFVTKTTRTVITRESVLVVHQLLDGRVRVVFDLNHVEMVVTFNKDEGANFRRWWYGSEL